MITLNELIKKYPEFKDIAFFEKEEGLWKPDPLDVFFLKMISLEDNDACEFLIFSNEIKNHANVYVDDGKRICDAVRTGNLTLVKLLFKKVATDETASKEERLYNLNYYFNNNRGQYSIMSQVLRENRLEILKYLMNVEIDGFHIEIKNDALLALPFAHIENTDYKSLVEYIFYETKFKASKGLKEFLNYNPIENKFMLQAVENNQKIRKTMQNYHKLSNELNEKNISKNNKLKI